jgi:3-oxoacyl-[acyl-carrier protein] reductase
MDLKLAGKTALITGGSKGIGRATAEIFAGEGCNVIIVSRNVDALAATKFAIAKKTNVRVDTVAAGSVVTIDAGLSARAQAF